ncbi:MAG: conjugal transfer protein TrbI [Candidatus Adiutrix sp.]|jgi:type IV secretion system protein VirB10|nr:conjugal transfer protein TrbI [Candidatus Adiutrix sp.]
MSNADPNFLETRPKVKKSNKNILLIIFLVLVLLAAVTMLMMTREAEKKEPDVPSASLESENKTLTPPVDDFGFVMPPESAPENKTDNEPKKDEPLIVVGPPPVDREAEARAREADEIRRRKFERDQQAYSSAMLVRRENSGASAPAQAAGESGGVDESTPYPPSRPDGYDPAADKDKEAFFERADVKQWISPHTREAGRPFELKTGTVVPGIMISGVNSDLPGSLIAQVSQNIYDTANGQSLLIPQGAKIFGAYDSRVVYGQRRVLVAWNRVVFPDGSSVTLGAMPGVDISGYAGFQDKVDNHYLRIFGSAILMSLIVGGTSYAVDQASNTTSDSNSTSVQDEMTAALAAQLGQATLQLLQKNLNIKPTLEIRPGYEFNIIVTKDIVFRGPYAGL